MSTGPTPAYLAEITTEAATGEIARIYEDIRRLIGGPLVACGRNAVIINLMSDTPKALTDHL